MLAKIEYRPLVCVQRLISEVDWFVMAVSLDASPLLAALTHHLSLLTIANRVGLSPPKLMGPGSVVSGL
jgi:hypothetical protein